MYPHITIEGRKLMIVGFIEVCNIILDVVEETAPMILTKDVLERVMCSTFLVDEDNSFTTFDFSTSVTKSDTNLTLPLSEMEKLETAYHAGLSYLQTKDEFLKNMDCNLVVSP